MTKNEAAERLQAAYTDFHRRGRWTETEKASVLLQRALAAEREVPLAALRAIVETWDEKAEDTVGENLLALAPHIAAARAVLALADSNA